MGQSNVCYVNLKTIAALMVCSHRLTKHLVKTGKLRAIRGYELVEQGIEPDNLRCGGYYYRNSWWVAVEDFISYVLGVWNPEPEEVDRILTALAELLRA